MVGYYCHDLGSHQKDEHDVVRNDQFIAKREFPTKAPMIVGGTIPLKKT